MYSGFVDIPAGGKRTVTATLEGSVALPDGSYEFDALRQRLATPERFDYSLTLGSGRLERVELDDEVARRVERSNRSLRLLSESKNGAFTLNVHLLRH